MTNDDAAILLFGVRYCFGRQTYAPKLCCDVLRRRWDEIRPQDQALILRDIRRELDMGDREMSVLGKREMPDDIREVWSSFVMWADERPVHRQNYRDLVREAQSGPDR